MVHVVPAGDGVTHDTAAEDLACVCGPRWGRFCYDDLFAEGWAIIHARLAAVSVAEE